MTENGLDITAVGAKGLKFILPLISGEVKALIGEEEKTSEIFFLTGGFIAKEHTILPDKDGNIRIFIMA